MKGRASGMPDESYWETFFNPACILDRLGCSGPCGDVAEARLKYVRSLGVMWRAVSEVAGSMLEDQWPFASQPIPAM